jgi:hypothetical protein
VIQGERSVLRDVGRIGSIGIGLALIAALGARDVPAASAWAAVEPTGGYAPFDDAVSVEAGGTYLIDVLANDAAVPEGAGDRLLILSFPSCGRANRVEGKIAYSADLDCAGRQTLTYCVPAVDACPMATLVLSVAPAPGQAPTAVDPTLTAGAPARKVARSGATPRIAGDDGGFPMGLGLPGPMDATSATSASARRLPTPGVDRAASLGAGRDARRDDDQFALDDAIPLMAPIAPVSAPDDRPKPKPRSIYASPALSTGSAQRPRLAPAMPGAADAPQAARTARDIASAPLDRVRLARSEAADRVGPDLPQPDDSAPGALSTRAQPRVGGGAALVWTGALADREGGVPELPFISELAEFRALVSLAAAPEADWSLPTLARPTRVAALRGAAESWAAQALRDDPPAARAGPSIEPIASLAATLTSIEAPAAFYRIASLDPLARLQPLGAPAQAPEPGAGVAPTAQARETTEPLPGPLAGLRARLMDLPHALPHALFGAPSDAGGGVAATGPAVIARQPGAAAAAPPREGPAGAQLAEATQPLPDHLARLGGAPAPAALMVAEDLAPARVPAAFGVRALTAQPAAWLAPAHGGAVAPQRREASEPLPPALVRLRDGAPVAPTHEFSLGQMISGARNMPAQSRRNLQILALNSAQAPRLLLLDQRPRDLNRAERSEPLPANLRDLRTFPPRLSQSVRLTADFFSVLRVGFPVRRYAELARPGIAARPAASFERTVAPRHLGSDPSPAPVAMAAIAAAPDLNAIARDVVGADAIARDVVGADVIARDVVGADVIALAPALGAGPAPVLGRGLELTPDPAPAPRAEAVAAPQLQPEIAPRPEAETRLAAAPATAPAATAPATAPAIATATAPAIATLAAAPPANCPLVFSAFPASGAMMQIEASSACRAGRVAVLHLEDLRIALRFDAEGVISVRVPGIGRDHQLSLVAEDGAAARSSITLLDSLAVERVALMWSAAVDIDLHAFEYGAGVAEAGHLRSGAPGDDRGFRRGRNGLISGFPALDGMGRSVEFYSFNPGRRTEVGRIELAVAFASRGDIPQAPYCGADPLASPSFRVHRFERGVMDQGETRIFNAAPCGAGLSDAQIYLKGLVQDILVVGR